MRTSNVLFSAVHFFVFFLILALGGCLLALPFAESVRMHLLYLIYYKPHLFMWIGASLLAFGLLLLTLLALINRRRFLTFEMEAASTQVDEKLAFDSIKHYWKDRYPQESSPLDVVIQKSNILEIIVQAPHNWGEDLEEHLLELERELGKHLLRHLGYTNPFYVTLSDSSI